jgi:tripartite-type tricarboxylate transporter receptor subunit TctC
VKEERREVNMIGITLRFFALASSIAVIAGTALADDYFKGKTISMFAGRPPGGGVDSEMRLIAQHLAPQIPGGPSIVPKNMPGAGGIALGNHIGTIAPPDGLSLGVPGRTAFILSPIIGEQNAKYDLMKLTWIGSSGSSNFALWIRQASGVKTIEDMRASKRELVIGGSGSGNADTVIPSLLAKEGFKLKIVRGYPGTAEEALAMERGEIDGMYTERASFRRDPVESGLALPVVQTFPVEKGVPLISEVVKDETSRGILKVFEVPLKVGLAVIAPPGTPPELTKTLREAYDKAVVSPAYLAAAKERGFETGKAQRGEDLAKYIQSSLSVLSPKLLDEFRRIIKE